MNKKEIDRIAMEVIKTLSNDEKYKCYNESKQQFKSQQHFFLGLKIRNEYLYKYNSLADTISAIIIERIWEIIHEQKEEIAKFDKFEISTIWGETVDLPFEVYKALESLRQSLKGFKISVIDDKIVISKNKLDGSDTVIDMKDIILDEDSFTEYEVDLQNKYIKLIGQYEKVKGKKWEDEGLYSLDEAVKYLEMILHNE